MLMPQFVTLVRRAARGTYPELQWDGQVIEPAPTETTLTLPREVAGAILRNNRYRMWTKPREGEAQGEYLHRFGIAEAAPDFVEMLGQEFLDTEPLEQTPVMEQWEAPAREERDYVPVPGVNPNMLAREIREATHERLSAGADRYVSR